MLNPPHQANSEMLLESIFCDNEYRVAFIRLAQSILRPGIPLEASDVVHDAYIRTKRNLASGSYTFDGYGKLQLLAFIRKCIVQIIRDANQKYRVRHSEVLLADSVEQVPSNETSSERIGVQDCVNELPSNQRAVLHLTFWERMTIDEIADAINSTNYAVGVLKNRALENVRKCLDGRSNR